MKTLIFSLLAIGTLALSSCKENKEQKKSTETSMQHDMSTMSDSSAMDNMATDKAADVGIAVGSGTDVAAETADIILVNSDPRDVVKMIDFGKKTYSKMIQNLVWAVGYNVVAIPLAAGVLYPTYVLSPAMGAVLMSVSTIVVALNASLLKIK